MKYALKFLLSFTIRGEDVGGKVIDESMLYDTPCNGGTEKKNVSN
jgi:hypothetical protein